MIDWTKPVKTRDGRPIRYMGHIEPALSNGPFEHVCCIGLSGSQLVVTYPADGRLLGRGVESVMDAVQLPESRRGDALFVNVYKKGPPVCHPSLSVAKRNAARNPGAGFLGTAAVCVNTEFDNDGRPTLKFEQLEWHGEKESQ